MNEYKILDAKKLLYGIYVCGMMYIEETCGELWSRLVSNGIVCTVNLSELFSLSLP